MDHFKVPPTFAELGKAVGKSYHHARRLAKAGVAPTKNFPEGQRIDREWANNYVENGLSEVEAEQYRQYFAEQEAAAG